jgi:hypothetical protein
MGTRPHRWHSLKPTPVQERTLNDNLFDAITSHKQLPDLIHALEHHPDNGVTNNYIQLARALANPKNFGVKFSVLCKRTNVHFRDLITFFLDYMRMQALYTVAVHIPDVVEHTMEGAKDRMIPCAACEGTGSVEKLIAAATKTKGPRVETKTCFRCQGSGMIREHGDPHDRKMAMELAHLIEQQQPLVQIYQGFGSPIEETMRYASNALSDVTEVKDVTEAAMEPGEECPHEAGHGTS